jgi:hypothetical protein
MDYRDSGGGKEVKNAMRQYGLTAALLLGTAAGVIAQWGHLPPQFEYVRDDGFDAPNAFDPTITLVSTVGTTVGLGTARQVQFAVRLNF